MTKSGREVQPKSLTKGYNIGGDFSSHKNLYETADLIKADNGRVGERSRTERVGFSKDLNAKHGLSLPLAEPVAQYLALNK